MIEQTLLLKLSSPGIADAATSRLRQEYQAYQKLFQTQPMLIQQYLSAQAASLAQAIIQGITQVHFSLPDQVVCMPALESTSEGESLPVDYREQYIGGLMNRLIRTDLSEALNQRLSFLEKLPNQAVSLSAGLLRFAIGIHMVYHVLPSGKSVIYANVDGDDIPNQPVDRQFESEVNNLTSRSSLTKETRVGDDSDEQWTPYVEAARRFYLPQWVAFDDQDQLLLSSISEAEGHITSMQHYLAILNSAIIIAPYMVADETYQQKRYGILGQLVNQGRALACYQCQEIIKTIQRRVAEHRLDRGLSISLPYFNDQTMEMATINFDVIPVGRIMFVPAFVVLAVRAQGLKVAQDMRLSQSTRRHLLTELGIIERTFLR